MAFDFLVGPDRGDEPAPLKKRKRVPSEVEPLEAAPEETGSDPLPTPFNRGKAASDERQLTGTDPEKPRMIKVPMGRGKTVELPEGHPLITPMDIKQAERIRTPKTEQEHLARMVGLSLDAPIEEVLRKGKEELARTEFGIQKMRGQTGRETAGLGNAQKKQSELATLIGPLETRYNEAQRLKVTRQREDAQTVIPRGELPITSNDDPRKGFESAGVNGKNQAKGVNDAEDAFKQEYGEEFSFDGPVAFTPGLQAAIRILDPSGRLAREMAQLAKPPAYGPDEPSGGIERPDLGPSLSKIPKPEKGQEPTETEKKLYLNFEERRQAAKDLADAEELQSWPAIVSFVLLSLAIGPQLAFVFFSNAKKKGLLKDYVSQLDEERKALRDEERFERGQMAENRQIVAGQLMRREAVKEDRRADFINRWALMQQRIASVLSQRGANEKDADLQDLVDSMNEYHKLAATKAKAMDFEGANEAIEAAESILPLIQKRRALLRAQRSSGIPQPSLGK